MNLKESSIDLMPSSIQLPVSETNLFIIDPRPVFRLSTINALAANDSVLIQLQHHQKSISAYVVLNPIFPVVTSVTELDPSVFNSPST